MRDERAFTQKYSETDWAAEKNNSIPLFNIFSFVYSVARAGIRSGCLQYFQGDVSPHEPNECHGDTTLMLLFFGQLVQVDSA